MDCFKYEYILTIAEEQSISKAAVRLYLSQPYLSKILRKVEEDLQVKLFTRLKSRLEPTPAGERYLSYVRQALELERQMRADVSELAGRQDQPFSFGIPRTRGSYVLPFVIPRFRERYGNIQFSIAERHYSDILQGILDRKILTGVLSNVSMPDCICYELIREEKILLVLPPNHPLGTQEAKSNFLTPPAFDEKRVPELIGNCCVTVPQHLGMGILVRKVMEDYGMQTISYLESNNLDTILRLVLSGAGFGLIPEYSVRVAQKAAEGYYFTLGDPHLQWSQVLAWRKDTNITPPMRYFMELCKEAFNYPYQS